MGVRKRFRGREPKEEKPVIKEAPPVEETPIEVELSEERVRSILKQLSHDGDIIVFERKDNEEGMISFGLKEKLSKVDIKELRELAFDENVVLHLGSINSFHNRGIITPEEKTLLEEKHRKHAVWTKD